MNLISTIFSKASLKAWVAGLGPAVAFVVVSGIYVGLGLSGILEGVGFSMDQALELAEKAWGWLLGTGAVSGVGAWFATNK